MQSLLGKLNFAASTVRVGRIFVSRIINAMKEFPTNGNTCRISMETKKDIKWWITYMNEFDGVSIMPPERFTAPGKIFSTDSCLEGCGGRSQGKAFHAPFPGWLRNRNGTSINELELITVVLAIKKWGKEMQNLNILAYCDNQVTCDVVNRGAASNKFAQACLREMCYQLAKINAVIKLVYISTTENSISDSLSRWHEPKARAKFNELTMNFPFYTQIPHANQRDLTKKV